MSLIVNLDEFSELCRVTSETMRVHIRVVPDDAPWLIKRGERGRGYEIEAEGGLAWWKSKREADDATSAERQAALQQLRFEHLGEAADTAEALNLSGRQRREEYAAVLERIKLRRTMGELVEVTELEAQATAAVIELRRRLLLVPAEFAVSAGLSLADVAPLSGMLTRAIEGFVTGLPVPMRGPADA